MTWQEIIAKVKALELPQSSYVVFGSCPMAVAGIRETNDIDMLVSSELLAQLEQAGWQWLEKAPGDRPLTHDVFEAHDSWSFSSYNPTLKHMLETADWVEGVPFASLEEVRKWKVASGRPKDLVDIKLIDKYFASRANNIHNH